MTELLLGCGHSREKRMMLPCSIKGGWMDLITLDSNRDCKPDILCDLDAVKWSGWSGASIRKAYFFDNNWFFKESLFHEIHAYEVLEHLGHQGDVNSFFSTFDNIYNLLTPNGYLFATCPSRFSSWLWGDPGHRRAIIPESLTFLDQTNYVQCGHTMMSDYRNIYQSDFKIILSTDDKQFHKFILQAIKPARKV